MVKKGGAVNISIETVMILVIAVVVLGLMLTLVKGWFSQAGKLIDIGPPDIKATADDPIHFPLQEGLLVISRGTKVNMKTSFYNQEADAIAEGQASINCVKSTEGDDLAVQVSTTPINVGVNQETTLSIQLQIPTDAKPTEYPCEMILSKTRKSFFIRVK